MLRAMGASVVAMVLMLVIGPAFIRWLRLNEFGQNIREDGPAGHLTKEGTPTMGGVLIWFAVVIPFLIFSRFSVASITVMIAALGNAFIGFIDDWIKIVRKRSLGLAARYKLLFQLVLALFIGFVAIHFVGLDTRVDIPFTAYKLQLGTIGFYTLIFLTLAGFSNAVNLTDGLDGLASGLLIFALLAFMAIALLNVPTQSNLALVCAIAAGTLVGFLWFNVHPASIFMGDAGSLSFGAALAVTALMTGQVLILPVIGLVFVVETGSVILQMGYFRLTHGKRIFLFTPIHHHFELLGWPETKVTGRFWIIGALSGLLGVTLFLTSIRAIS